MTPDELRDAIKTLGFSALGFARRANVAGRTIRQWLGGDRGIPGPVVALVELLLEVPAAREHFAAKGWDHTRPADPLTSRSAGWDRPAPTTPRTN